MKDYMIDIETEGNGPRATVLSIAVVQFDLATGETGFEFYGQIKPELARQIGESDPDTVKWWQEQDEDARAAAYGGLLDPRGVAKGLIMFFDRCREIDTVWGSGATFDITILEHWFAACGYPVPWRFWHIRDVRTLVDLGWRLARSEAKSAPFEGTPHHPLDDCKHQIRYCYGTYKALQGARNGKAGRR